jgi:hypothetical protein
MSHSVVGAFENHWGIDQSPIYTTDQHSHSHVPSSARYRPALVPRVVGPGIQHGVAGTALHPANHASCRDAPTPRPFRPITTILVTIHTFRMLLCLLTNYWFGSACKRAESVVIDRGALAGVDRALHHGGTEVVACGQRRARTCPLGRVRRRSADRAGSGTGRSRSRGRDPAAGRQRRSDLAE